MFTGGELFVVAGSASLFRLIALWVRWSVRGKADGDDSAENVLRRAVSALESRRLNMRGEAESTSPRRSSNLRKQIAQLERAEKVLLVRARTLKRARKKLAASEEGLSVIPKRRRRFAEQDTR